MPLKSQVIYENRHLWIKIIPEQPLFIQYLNPEILRLYGVASFIHTEEFYKIILGITKFGFLVCRDKIIMPGSYLFEVPIIHRFLKNIEPLSKIGLFQVASPSPILLNYVNKKRNEYRDENALFSRYNSDAEDEINIKLHWLPRLKHASIDIAHTWQEQLLENGLWQEVLQSRAGTNSPISKWETAILSVPERLDGRAFITRYAQPLLPFPLNISENTNMDLLISRAYLESYLEEFGAFIIVDTKLGMLDCGITNPGINGALRAIPIHPIVAFFELLKVRHLIESRMGWLQLLELRSRPIMQWIIEMLLIDILCIDRPLQKALLASHYQNPDVALMLSGKEAIDEIEARVWRLYDKVQSFLANVLDEELSLVSDSVNFSSVPKLLLPKGTRYQQLSLFATIKEDCKMYANTVFLVHGRDTATVSGIRALLRAAALNPLDWDEVVSWTGTPSPPTLDVIKLGISRSQAILIILTPDEEVKLRQKLIKEEDLASSQNYGFQPRPNVLLEIGMAVAICPERTLLLSIGSTRTISDISGLNYLDFDGTSPSRNALIRRLGITGCQPKLSDDFFRIPFDMPIL